MKILIKKRLQRNEFYLIFANYLFKKALFTAHMIYLCAYFLRFFVRFSLVVSYFLLIFAKESAHIAIAQQLE